LAVLNLKRGVKRKLIGHNGKSGRKIRGTALFRLP